MRRLNVKGSGHQDVKGSAQGQGQGHQGQTVLQVHNYNANEEVGKEEEEDVVVTPVKPSAKALGKRKVVEPIEHERESFFPFPIFPHYS